MQGNASTLANILSIHSAFLLNERAAKEIINQQIDMLDIHWQDMCIDAGLSNLERSRL